MDAGVVCMQLPRRILIAGRTVLSVCSLIINAWQSMPMRVSDVRAVLFANAPVRCLPREGLRRRGGLLRRVKFNVSLVGQATPTPGSVHMHGTYV
jgi:hypothetical protein